MGGNKTSSKQMSFKNLERKESRKRIISASDGLGSLQIISKPDTRGFGGVPHRLEKGMSVSEGHSTPTKVDCEIPRWVERRTKHCLYVGS